MKHSSQRSHLSHDQINPLQNLLPSLKIPDLHLHLVILQMLLSKATNNWGIHKAINLEEANRQRKCP